MPTLISISKFLDETNDDYHSPITSTFVAHMQQFRNTITLLEETLDFDRDGLTKMKKAIKAIHASGNHHVENELYLAKALQKVGSKELKDYHDDVITEAFEKFSVVTTQLSLLKKTLMQNLSNIVMFPLDNLLKGDLRGVKGDLKRPFDKSWKDYENRFAKIEKEKKQQAKDAGLIRSEITAAEIADEVEKERRLFQFQMCEYLIKYNEIRTKKGIDLLQNLVEYYHAQTNYFQDGLKTIEYFGYYVADLSVKLQKIRQQQDDEKRKLTDLRNLIRTTPSIEKEVGGSALHVDRNAAVYSLHQLQGDKHLGVTRTGYLLKKSEGKMRRVWQKRKCRVQADGYLDICHADENKTPTRVNLLTCQIKVVPDDKRGFDLVSYNRTYHFQAEDEIDQHAWMSVLVNCKEMALLKAFDDSGRSENENVNHSLLELQQAIIRFIQKIPGNDRCCDCSSQNDATWLSTNFGIIVCIECSGIHRDLGVHISRIQSLTLDNVGTSQLVLARFMSNHNFNDIMEAQMGGHEKLHRFSTMEERLNFIRAKYVDKQFVVATCENEMEKLYELEEAVNRTDLGLLLQMFGENVDLGAPLPSSEMGETALHRAVLQEVSGRNLHIVDFLIQNMPTISIDKTTFATPPIDHWGGANTALHLCAIYGKVECMKLLLRSGASTTVRNSSNKTPMDIVQELGHHTCQDLLQNAANRLKIFFDNINIDWNLSHDEASTDFSDDDTIIEERNYEYNGSVTPEKKNRSRPPSYSGADSPVALRSRSSTCDSLQMGGSPLSSSSNASSFGSTFNASIGSNMGSAAMAATSRQMPPPPPQSRKPDYLVHGSLKKRTAPLPPLASASSFTGSTGSMQYGTLPNNHNKTSSSDAMAVTGYHTLSHTHKRSPSTDSTSVRSVIPTLSNKLVISSSLSSSTSSSSSESKPGGTSLERIGNALGGSIRRPQNPPPTPPAMSGRLSNGRSNESLSSLLSDVDMVLNPVPSPRRASDSPTHSSNGRKLSQSPVCSMSARSNATPTSGTTPINRISVSAYASHINSGSDGGGVGVLDAPKSPPVASTTISLPSSVNVAPSTIESGTSGGGVRRCRALYDCVADNEDELSFNEGEIIIVTNEQTDDDNWMEGMVENESHRKGMFPIGFVHMLPD